MAKGEKPILSVRIDAKVLERVDKMAERAGVGRAEVVERCLTLGLLNQEEMVQWLESPIKGPVAQAMTHPAIVALMARMFNEEVDPTSMQLRNNVLKDKKSKRGSLRPATQ